MANPEQPPSEELSRAAAGWLSGLIKPDPEPLPPRPQEADSFSPTGNWLARAADQVEAESLAAYEAEQQRRAARKGKRAESPTGEVPLDAMLTRSQEVEQRQPRTPNRFEPAHRPAWAKPARPEESLPPDKAPTAPPPAQSAATQPTRKADAPPANKPTQAEVESASPGWARKIETASSPKIEPLKPAPSKAAQIDRVVTSIPKRSLMQAWSASVQRQRVSFYRALTTMLGAGLPMVGVFEFMAHQAESEDQRGACRRISRDLISGYALHKAAYKEPYLFSEIAVKLIEIGIRSGKLVAVLQRLAADEEDRWRLRQTLQSHLMYPVCIASLTLVAVVLLPPFVLADLLNQVVRLTSEPPALTRAILWFSTSLSSPGFLAFVGLAITGAVIALNSHNVRQKILSVEPLAWEVPGLGPLIRSAVALRFLRVFAMTYDVGLAAPQCLVLAAEATGSRKAIAAGPRMKTMLIDGGTLKESLDIGDFLPPLVVESMEAAQQSGDVSGMMESVARIVDSELEYRIETLMSIIEPLFMAVLGVLVGLFAVGCLLPILKLSETL